MKLFIFLVDSKLNFQSERVYESLMTDGLQIVFKMSSPVIALTHQKFQFTGTLSVKMFEN